MQDSNNKQFWKTVQKIEDKRDAEHTPVLVTVVATLAVVFVFLLWHKGPEFWKNK